MGEPKKKFSKGGIVPGAEKPTNPPRTRDWTEMDVLRKILFELRQLNENLVNYFSKK
jgi:hypothetical protein